MAMTCFVGLDVSVKETAVCIVDDTGKLMCEQQVPTEPDDIVTQLIPVGDDYGRVGVAQRHGMPRVIVAVARRLAVILHRRWVDDTEFRWSNSTTAVVPQAA